MEAIKINEVNNHQLKESEIIKRILTGEKELYEILVRRNNQKLYRIIRSYLKAEAEADVEDVMQNSYIKGFTKLDQFKLESSFSTWLIRIGINESLARLNGKEKIIQLNNPYNNPNGNSTLEIPDYKQLNPHETMIRKEAKQLIENAIDHLDTKYKSVYMRREGEEMSILEIAYTLDLTVSNVKVRLYRAKEMLKEKLYELNADKNIFEFGFSRCDRITERVMNNI